MLERKKGATYRAQLVNPTNDLPNGLITIRQWNGEDISNFGRGKSLSQGG